MKVRLEDQRIVFRLSEKDRESLTINRSIESRINFESSSLAFAITLTNDSNLAIENKERKIAVFMPESYMEKWDEVKVGFEEVLEYSDGTTLTLIIEKDLKRSKRRDKTY